ncbi:MOSC domain-containing protein [Saccharothrix australiensis]|uniref:MOSC domain-containing protein YiiM n=1 Tax=Saccharothrix australiensis TaxID=2072 RepID=A0A495W8X0_9PSEU|nr:MOSC domain-containing protein [Saccharothrix australiensis]RKT56238.1 MOSC domain-containing protein YiiM [Saccharothrix australiensis]
MGIVEAVSRSAEYTFTKPNAGVVRLLAGLGVEGDAHAGELVKHRSRVRRDPTRPNLRQVHLMHAELHDELNALGFSVTPGGLGENITTRGVDLLGLSAGTLLRLGAEAVVEVTGLRNPCPQIDAYQDGLLKHVVGRDDEGNVVRRAGIMSVVVVSGDVRPGDGIRVEPPAGPHVPMGPV